MDVLAVAFPMAAVTAITAVLIEQSVGDIASGVIVQLH